jgi:hypothetical protein
MRAFGQQPGFACVAGEVGGGFMVSTPFVGALQGAMSNLLIVIMACVTRVTRALSGSLIICMWAIGGWPCSARLTAITEPASYGVPSPQRCVRTMRPLPTTRI